MDNEQNQELRILANRARAAYFYVLTGSLIYIFISVIWSCGYTGKWASLGGILSIALLLTGISELHSHIKMIKLNQEFIPLAYRARVAYHWILSGWLIAMVLSAIWRFGYEWANWGGAFGILIMLTGLKGLYSYVKIIRNNGDGSI